MSRPDTRSSVSRTGTNRDGPNGEIEDDERWTTGEVSLISADDVRFRVAGLTLAWSSPVFDDLLTLPGNQTNKTIHLTDDSIETAEVIRLYLDLVSVNFERLNIFYRTHTRWRILLMRLTSFLDKYQSERGLKLLRSFGAEGVAMGRFVKLSDFVFAARLNDIALCYRILSKNKSSNADKEGKVLGAMEGSWMLSLAHQSYETACAIPPPFQWALARANELEQRQASPRDFAQRFVELIATIHQQGE